MTRDEMATQEDANGKDDAPLIDLNEASVKKLIMKAKRRGYEDLLWAILNTKEFLYNH